MLLLQNLKQMKIIKLLFAALLLCMGIMGCEEDKKSNFEETFISTIQKVKVDIVEKNSLPNWLRNKVEELESNIDLSTTEIKVFQGKWKSQKMYFILNNLSSCVFCEVYNNEGIKINWTERNDFNAFLNHSDSWKCIYIIKMR